jgi:hypothetical protein
VVACLAAAVIVAVAAVAVLQRKRETEVLLFRSKRNASVDDDPDRVPVVPEAPTTPVQNGPLLSEYLQKSRRPVSRTASAASTISETDSVETDATAPITTQATTPVADDEHVPAAPWRSALAASPAHSDHSISSHHGIRRASVSLRSTQGESWPAVLRRTSMQSDGEVTLERPAVSPPQPGAAVAWNTGNGPITSSTLLTLLARRGSVAPDASVSSSSRHSSARRMSWLTPQAPQTPGSVGDGDAESTSETLA